MLASDATLTSFCMLFSSVDENVCDRFGNVSSVNPLFLKVCSHIEASYFNLRCDFSLSSCSSSTP